MSDDVLLDAVVKKLREDLPDAKGILLYPFACYYERCPSDNQENDGAVYGLSIVDDDSIPFTGPDCAFGYIPTLIKYGEEP